MGMEGDIDDSLAGSEGRLEKVSVPRLSDTCKPVHPQLVILHP